jgi:transcription initiation protein SPT3
MSEKDKFKYKVEIQQMMFVSGETGEPTPETTGVIEEMVRGQVIEMVSSPPCHLIPSLCLPCRSY